MNDRQIACFSMEMALHPDMPTYSGGLGVLASDTIRSADDLKLPMAAVTLQHRKGYFAQKLDANGWQMGAPIAWDVARLCREIQPRVQVAIEGRPVHVRELQHAVKRISGHEVPVTSRDRITKSRKSWRKSSAPRTPGGAAMENFTSPTSARRCESKPEREENLPSERKFGSHE